MMNDDHTGSVSGMDHPSDPFFRPLVESFEDDFCGLNFNKANHKSLWPEDSGPSGLDDFATDLVMALVLIPVVIFFFVVFFM